MFHHFHNNVHVSGQGSITAEDFADMLQFLGRDNILSADDWYKKALSGNLKDTDLCITFDDGLKCQYDIAYPVLTQYGIKAFWFVYTSPFETQIEWLEVYRYFRSSNFENIDEFYDAFFQYINQTEYKFEVSKELKSFNPNNYLEDFPFYSNNDRIFRFLRDDVLGPARYHDVMKKMLIDYKVDLKELQQKLWMSANHIKQLHSEGHMIGLHSHTHPTRLDALSKSEQKREYTENYHYLSSMLQSNPISMSHPCNSYNNDTLSILEELQIHIGFRANMVDCQQNVYEFPREDHANIMKEMISKR